MEAKSETPKSAAVRPDLQKMKMILDFIKWFIVSVALVVITMIIDYGFRDRAAGIKEAAQYDKYVTDIVVMNSEVGKRRLLAQYFSKVLPSDKLRKCWENYYWVVNAEYLDMMKRDSILETKLKGFMSMKAVTPEQEVELQALSRQKRYTEKQLYSDFKLPQSR